MYRSVLLMAILLGCLSPTWPAWSAGLEEPFIICDVYTRVGQDFYQKFCATWNSLQGIPMRDIVITEEAGVRASSRLQVLVDGEVAYVGLLSLRGADVRAEVDRAVALSFRHMITSVADAEDPVPELSGPGIDSGI